MREFLYNSECDYTYSNTTFQITKDALLYVQ